MRIESVDLPEFGLSVNCAMCRNPMCANFGIPFEGEIPEGHQSFPKVVIGMGAAGNQPRCGSVRASIRPFCDGSKLRYSPRTRTCPAVPVAQPAAGGLRPDRARRRAPGGAGASGGVVARRRGGVRPRLLLVRDVACACRAGLAPLKRWPRSRGAGRPIDPGDGRGGERERPPAGVAIDQPPAVGHRFGHKDLRDVD